jgi:azurin
MKKHNILLPIILLALTWLTPCAHASDGRVIELIAYDTMKYNLIKIQAKPGEKLTVVLTSEGLAPKTVMAHNWVLLKAGADPMSYAMSAMSAVKEGYEPKSLASQVIAAIPQLGPKETAKTTFTVPTTPGTYPFLCSFPAHCMAGMKGVLVVK